MDDSSKNPGANAVTPDGMGSEQTAARPRVALNVNAMPFIPGQNVAAKEFVPSYESPSVPDPGIQNSNEINENSKQAAVSIDGIAQPLDAWDDESEENGTTPDKEEADEQLAAVTDTMTEASLEDKEEEPAKEDAKPKDHLNIVFIGHVDAGKSTIGGHIMYLTGQVEKRTLEKYEREAKEKNRETWYLSWALDTNLEERDKGKTVEVGRAYFETENKHFTILDAPGHKSFVPKMIAGASQADVAVLVISARKGEFETGFERGGQTREHAMLVKTAGVKQLVVVVNKMDDPTVQWAEERYNEIKSKLTPYLKKCGFNPKLDTFYLPVSGLTGINLKERNSDNCPWYKGPSLLEYLDQLDPVCRMAEGPVRLPVVDRYNDMGTIILGKLESGVITKKKVLTLMPNKVQVVVDVVWSHDKEVNEVFPGDNVKLKLKNVEEEDVSSGFVLCSVDSICNTGKVFDAQIVIMEHKSIICPGYSAVMHIHTAEEEVAITSLLLHVDRKTGAKTRIRTPFIKQDQIAIVRFEVTRGSVCLETFKKFPQMGRFTLRDEGRTVAIGKVLKIFD